MILPGQFHLVLPSWSHLSSEVNVAYCTCLRIPSYRTHFISAAHWAVFSGSGNVAPSGSSFSCCRFSSCKDALVDIKLLLIGISYLHCMFSFLNHHTKSTFPSAYIRGFQWTGCTQFLRLRWLWFLRFSHPAPNFCQAMSILHCSGLAAHFNCLHTPVFPTSVTEPNLIYLATLRHSRVPVCNRCPLNIWGMNELISIWPQWILSS